MYSVCAGHLNNFSCTASIGEEGSEQCMPTVSQGDAEAAASNHSANEVSPCCAACQVCFCT